LQLLVPFKLHLVTNYIWLGWKLSNPISKCFGWWNM